LPSVPSPRSSRNNNLQERPSTPSMRNIDSKTQYQPSKITPNILMPQVDEFADFSSFDITSKNPVTVEVKPLPKIRLDLCPVPREEDEEEDGSSSANEAKKKSKSKHKHKHRKRT
jgi:hypothetical protein